MLGRRLAGASAVLAAVVVVALSSLPTTDAARTEVTEAEARICDLRSVGGGGLILGHDFDLGMGKNKYGEDQPLKALQVGRWWVGQAGAARSRYPLSDTHAHSLSHTRPHATHRLFCTSPGCCGPFWPSVSSRTCSWRPLRSVVTKETNQNPYNSRHNFHTHVR